MSVYNLHNPKDLENDLNNIIRRLNEIYHIEIDNSSIKILPKLSDNSSAFWASPENTSEFNKLVPTFKNLHKDMYSFIESFVSLATNEKYEYAPFERKYQNYKEFRLLNNMFKHPDRKQHSITFIKVNYIETKQYDLICNFHYPNGESKSIGYSEFVKLFIEILLGWKAIKWSNPKT